ncbi:ArsR/SmtB family transcription factor [Pelagicoccus mobilis]|uniref:Winged helix-turn-helix transcriptional regulator n=1 Tax=Pelagicoccus mobilis TaxID=415221 RepID=A0A934S012_9BACT|nr:metalloregulator ArsR/SmtB family transcription factor [Pelagicoccus mobilis]MBK1879872.1 winged helix-turn-helix transcriptional regulator [Pelagicoccus mobilis]
MVKEWRLDRVFHALSDPTRRGILQEIAKGSPSVGELGRPFEMSAPAISKHLKVLEQAELVTRVKEGTVNRFRLNPEPFAEVRDLLEALTQVWFERLDRPEEVFEDDELEDHLI